MREALPERTAFLSVNLQKTAARPSFSQNAEIEGRCFMDAVSDVLRVVRLGGAVYLHAELTAPWCLLGQTDQALCTSYLPTADRVVSYHLVTEGTCWAQL